ncbi:Thymidine kinase [Candidatus Phytoplasma mali]|uniref:Thymidine kinase n=1 Tax=Phytoplasma mali (strain AT) TaxID=482235 RepID=B3R0G3_PHYMT|nr:thymidine kinase [Candidatus Phytoplasma mali]CAP18327.1 Thymidine kinase [Candidatus Phytoplasma mali]
MSYDEHNLIEIICGPMFAGKTEKIIEIFKKLKKLNKKVLVFKSKLDIRFSKKQELVSHNLNTINSFVIEKSKEILDFIKIDTEIIIIDEVQFLDNQIVDIVDYLANKNIKSIIAGLDLDFRGKPFGPMPFLLSIADKVTKLKSICSISGQPANRTQRLINQKPAINSEPIIMTEDNEIVKYEPRNRKYHEFKK